jgi:hypothetical protein
MDKKFKRIILHVGPDKTGSTAIQRVLYGNRQLLLSEGIQYSSGKYECDHKLAMHFSERPELLFPAHTLKVITPKIINQYTIHLEKTMKESDANEMILSFEGFIHLTSDELVKIREWLMTYTDSIFVIMYAREAISYARSGMSQRVKKGVRIGVGMDLPFISYKVLIEKLIAVYGREAVNVRIFEPEKMKGESVVLDFLSLFNFSKANFEQKLTITTPIANRSLSLEAMLVGDRVISLINEEAYSKTNFIENILPYLKAIDGEKFVLSFAQYLIIKLLSHEHSLYLREEYSISFKEQKNILKSTASSLNASVDAQAQSILLEHFPQKYSNKPLFFVNVKNSVYLCFSIVKFLISKSIKQLFKR